MIVEAFFVSRESGKSQTFKGHPSEFPWVFPRGLYQIGMDQSSSRTGIYLTNPDVTFHLIMHITRKYETIEVYFNNIRLMLNSLLRNSSLDLFVREEPLPDRGGRASQILWSLVGIIETWKNPHIGLKALAEMGGDKFGRIPPNVWRKHVVDKKKGPYRSTVKREIALDILDIYPELVPYFDIVPASSDYDGFEACGVLIGYKKEHNLVLEGGKTVSTVIAGSKEYTGYIRIYYRPYNSKDVEQMDFVGYFKELFRERELLVYEPNPEKTLYDNTRISASKHDICLLIYTDPIVIKTTLMSFQMKGDYDTLAVYVVRDNILGSRLTKVLDSAYKGELQTWW